MKYCEDHRLGYSQFSCVIAWASLQLSLYSCCILIGWCPYSPWVTCIHVWHRCSSLMERLLQVLKHIDVCMTLPVFPCSSTRSEHYRYRGLKARRNNLRVCIPWSHNWPCHALCALSVARRALGTVVTSSIAEKCVAPFDSYLSRKLGIWGHALYNVLYVLK
jgi:hypothetical protein